MSKPKFVPVATNDNRTLDEVINDFKEQGYQKFRFHVANGGLWLVCKP